MATVPEIITNKIIEQLEKGNIPWKQPWKGFPCNLISKKNYNGINVVLLSMNSFSSPYYLTYKQAQSKGGNVKKGEKGSLVVYRKQTTKEVVNNETEEVEYKSYSLLRYYNVFNIEQTEGLDHLIPDSITINNIECCEEVINNMPMKPEIKFEGLQACYSPSKDNIKMPSKNSFFSSEEFYSTLFHELVHSTAHEKRLNRDLKNGFGTDKYAKEELIAEIGASFLCGHCSIENTTIENSGAYIKGWLSKLKNDKKFVISAASLAQKAYNFITEKEN